MVTEEQSVGEEFVAIAKAKMQSAREFREVIIHDVDAI